MTLYGLRRDLLPLVIPMEMTLKSHAKTDSRFTGGTITTNADGDQITIDV